MTLKDLADSLRGFEGVRRKRAIEPLVRVFHQGIVERKDVLASFGEDAAVIGYDGENHLLMAADGIWSRLMVSDPKWAGYCAVLVNVHDIAAMGGKPIAMVDVFSVSKKDTCEQVSLGMSEAVEKFNVPIVGGHIHPDTPYDALDVAIIGSVRKDAIIYSSTANVGDDVLFAVDLDGRVHPSSNLNWDSTSSKKPKIIQTQIKSMRVLGESHLLTAGKDVSNPGIVGTLGMLLELSCKGAVLDINSIPIPKKLDLAGWLKMYPGMGFIVTSKKENTKEVILTFKKHGLTCERVGEITDDSTLTITDGDDKADVFDFKKDTITGLAGRG